MCGRQRRTQDARGRQLPAAARDFGRDARAGGGRERRSLISRRESRKRRNNMANTQILYFSSVDVSLPNGPGVNEREFIEVLHKRFGDGVILVIPTPQVACEFLQNTQVYYCISHRNYHPVRYAIFLLHQLWLVFRAIRYHEVGLVVTRLSPLPVVAGLVQKVFKVPLAI